VLKVRFDSSDAKRKESQSKMELNFKPDGTRFLYEDITQHQPVAWVEVLQMSSPALSVINIKVRVEE
jgi:hypothetical protein